MDLESFSSDDLKAMKSGDISAMSSDGLKMLKQAHMESSAAPAGPAQTFAERAGNAAMGGYLPQVTAGLSKNVVFPLVDLVKGSKLSELGPSYTDMRDQTAAELAAHKAQNPIAGWSGDIAGAVGGSVGIGALAKAAGLGGTATTLGQKMIQGAKAGGVYGLLANPGETPGEVSPVQPVARAVNGTIGTVTGALAPAVFEGAKAAGSKFLGAITNTPKAAVRIYGERAPEVSNVISQSGGELPVAADAMKEKVLGSITATKAGLSKEIEGALLTGDPDRTVPVQPIIDKLHAARANLNPHYNAGDIAQIDEMIQAIQSDSPTGHMSLKNLWDTTNYLRTQSSGSFIKNGAVFMNGDKAAQAANSARKIATDTLHQEAPAIAHADSVYADLHDLDNKMSSALLGTGKSESVFASAGGGKGNINQVMLRKIGELTGTKPLSDSELIFAAKYFKDPSFRQALLRMGLDVGHAASANAPTGVAAVVGNRLASPDSEPPTDSFQRRLQSTKK